MSTQTQLDAHEALCLERYNGIKEKLDSLEKRMWRLEAMIMGSTFAMVALAAMLFSKVM
jgi:hypothetical protein